jgi:hypothetical protein
MQPFRKSIEAMTTAAKLQQLVTEREAARHRAHIIASAKIHIDGQLEGVYCGENDPIQAIRNIQAQADTIGLPEVNVISNKAITAIEALRAGFK